MKIKVPIYQIKMMTVTKNLVIKMMTVTKNLVIKNLEKLNHLIKTKLLNPTFSNSKNTD